MLASRVSTMPSSMTPHKRMTLLIWTRRQGWLLIIRSIGCCSQSIFWEHTTPTWSSHRLSRASTFKSTLKLVMFKTLIALLSNNRFRIASVSILASNRKSRSLDKQRRILRHSQCKKIWEHVTMMKVCPSRFNSLMDSLSLIVRKLIRI